MPYVQMPKDLTKVKTKVAFNLTKRQIICFGLAAVCAVPTYFLTRPFFLFAMYEKNGLPFEKIAKAVIKSRFLRPKVRPYKTENVYEYAEKQYDLEKEVKAIINEDR